MTTILLHVLTYSQSAINQMPPDIKMLYMVFLEEIELPFVNWQMSKRLSSRTVRLESLLPLHVSVLTIAGDSMSSAKNKLTAPSTMANTAATYNVT